MLDFRDGADRRRGITLRRWQRRWRSGAYARHARLGMIDRILREAGEDRDGAGRQLGLSPTQMEESRARSLTRIEAVLPSWSHNNFGIRIVGPSFLDISEEAILPLTDRFRDYAYRRWATRWMDDPEREEKLTWGAFFQGGFSPRDPSWAYVEFWAPQTTGFRLKVETEAKKIAEMLHVSYGGWSR